MSDGEYISHHCLSGAHLPACLKWYAGQECKCVCHIPLENRRGWE